MRLGTIGILLFLLAAPGTAQDVPRFQWEHHTTENGLPDNRVFVVCVDGSRVWAGTDDGLGLYENGKWKIYRPADGLAHQAVLSLAVSPKTGDLWVGTMGGLNRFSAGRFDTFNQLNSGLTNDIVYGVGVQDHYLWAATAAGLSRLDTRTGQWSQFHERNTPMREIWNYSVSVGEDKVYSAVWGGGLLEYDIQTERWKDYRDPDGESEIVLLKDQGMIHDVAVSVSYVNRIVWAATYFGAARYDGRHWQTFLDKDSGLASNFINQVKSPDGVRAWFATDKGVSFFDGETWVTYRPALDTKKPEMLIRDASGRVTRLETDSAPAHNYTFAVDFQGDDIWVATAKGLSRGIRIRQEVGN